MTLDMISGQSTRPKAFVEGLNFWRSDLNDGSLPRLDELANVSLGLAADDFYGQLLISKTSDRFEAVQAVRTPTLTGQYLEISFEITLISGAAPQAHILGLAREDNGGLLSNAAQEGPSFDLITGVPIRVSAIVGTSARDGVDLVWSPNAATGEFGFALTGPNGAQIAVKNMQIRDVTAAFTALHTGVVDIRDYGAIGDGSFDNSAAFLAADSAANGRTIFVPEGDYYIAERITIHSPLQFAGQLVTELTTPIMLVHQYDLETYVHAFKNEELAFRKAFQALFYFSDHNFLDMRGRKVTLTAPVRFAELLPEQTGSRDRKILANGELIAGSSTAWDVETVTSDARFVELSTGGNILENVTNVADIEIGSLVTGRGVGRETYVTGKDEAAQTISLSNGFFGPLEQDSYSFTRFRYMIDFCEVTIVSDFEVTNVTFLCRKRASAIILARSGTACKFCHMFVHYPANRGITSYHGGCNGMTVESCNFEAGEWSTLPQDRHSIAVNTHSSDMKIRNNRASYFRHFAVMDGGMHIIVGNHFFQGRGDNAAERTAAIVGTSYLSNSSLVGNHFDNCQIEISLESRTTALNDRRRTLGLTTISGNFFTFLKNVGKPWLSWIVFTPIGTAQAIKNISITNNSFANYGDMVDRIESVNTAYGTVDLFASDNVNITNNVYFGVRDTGQSPNVITVSRATAAREWVIDLSDAMPFQAPAKSITGLTAHGDVVGSKAAKIMLESGADRTQAILQFDSATKGTFSFTAHISPQIAIEQA